MRTRRGNLAGQRGKTHEVESLEVDPTLSEREEVGRASEPEIIRGNCSGGGCGGKVENTVSWSLCRIVALGGARSRAPGEPGIQSNLGKSGLRVCRYSVLPTCGATDSNSNLSTALHVTTSHRQPPATNSTPSYLNFRRPSRNLFFPFWFSSLCGCHQLTVSPVTACPLLPELPWITQSRRQLWHRRIKLQAGLSHRSVPRPLRSPFSQGLERR